MSADQRLVRVEACIEQLRAAIVELTRLGATLGARASRPDAAPAKLAKGRPRLVDPARVAALHAGGLSDEEVAAQLRVSPRTVGTVRQSLRLPPNARVAS
jgi:DNA-binding NarL/FixJ family response regulator